MVKTAVVTWQLPTSRESGGPLDIADIQHVEVSLSADLGVNFSILGNVTPLAAQERTIPDLVDGDYVVRLVVVDVNGLRSANVDTSFLIDTSAPGTVTNVVVDLV